MNFHVDNTHGDDANSGSWRQPWRTLAKVNDAIFRPGDSILFKRGEVWTEELNCYRSTGEKNKPITFGPYGNGAMPIIEGRVFIDGCRGNVLSYIAIDGLEIRNAVGRGVWMLNVGVGCSVRNCVVHDISADPDDNGQGINFDGYPGRIKTPLVENNRVYNISDIGIQLENCYDEPIIRNNIVSGCNTSGLTVTAYPEHDLEDGITAPGMAGLPTNGKVQGNLVYGCAIGVSVFSTAGWEFTHNAIADGINDKTGVIWFYDDIEDMTGLIWNDNTIANCDQVMLFKFDYGLLLEHDFNCYVGGTFNRLNPWQMRSLNEFREETGQEKHSIETALAIGAYEYTG